MSNVRLALFNESEKNNRSNKDHRFLAGRRMDNKLKIQLIMNAPGSWRTPLLLS